MQATVEIDRFIRQRPIGFVTLPTCVVYWHIQDLRVRLRHTATTKISGDQYYANALTTLMQPQQQLAVRKI